MVWFGKRKMVGGMAFGPPGWMPERIEETFDGPASAPPNATVPLLNTTAAAQVTTPPPLITTGASHNSGAESSNTISAPIATAAVAPTTGGAPGGGASSARRVVLTDRHSLLEMLASMKLPRASAMVPGLAEQVEGLDGRAVRAMVLVLLPTQPEYVLGPALSRLAMEEMRAGMEALKKALMPRETLVVMDRHDFATRQFWKEAAAALGARRVPLLNQYPEAHPTVLVRRVFGEILPAGALPSTRDLVLVDPVSCWALGRHVRTGQAFNDRPVQVFTQDGPARLLMGRIGEPFAEFLKRFQVVEQGALKSLQVIVNGMLTGQQMLAGHAEGPPTGMPLVGAMTESISLREPIGNEPPTPCIACGWCVDVCPTGLTPIHLMQLNHRPTASTLRSRDALEARHCIGCGLCSYVCPTRLPLMEQTVALGRKVGKKL